MAYRETICKSGRSVVITANESCALDCGLNWEECAALKHPKTQGTFHSRLYVNGGETATGIAASAVTLAGARKQANAMLDGMSSARSRATRRRRVMDGIRRDCGLVAGRDSSGRKIWE